MGETGANDGYRQPAGSPFVRKLGTYLVGVAIGLMFLGWVQFRKSQAKLAQQAETAAAVEAQPEPKANPQPDPGSPEAPSVSPAKDEPEAPPAPPVDGTP